VRRLIGKSKLRCDVVQDPFTICSRCRRLGLSCKVQENFKRIGKRSRNAEMEREIVELRKQIVEQTTPTKNSGLSSHNATHSGSYVSEDQYGSNEAVEGLMGLSGGLNALKRIEDVLVTQDCIAELFSAQVPRSILGRDYRLISSPVSSPFPTHSSRFSPQRRLRRSTSNTVPLYFGA
jgi:hypothetical protein